MKLATLLLVLLSNQGYWFGGREGSITFRPAARGGLPKAVISWDLMIDHVRLAGGEEPLPEGDDPGVIRFTPPATRARVTLHWKYRLVAANDRHELEAGDVPINLFPDDLSARLPDILDGKTLAVWDKPQGLPALLDRAKVRYTLAKSPSDLQVSNQDIVLVGMSVIGESPFDQTPLAGLAESGASVMIFLQPGPATLMGYPLQPRDVPLKLQWREDHPLLQNFEPDDLQSWMAGVRQFRCVQLPADEPALEIGYYPRETPGIMPAPIDAVLLTKSVGKGRIVLCQLPLGEWVTDPRSQILLRNAMNYLLTRPQPTPRPSERPTAPPVLVQPVPTIQLSPGESK